MPIAHRTDHFTINTDNLAATREFYAELGLKPGPRPNMAFFSTERSASESALYQRQKK